MKYFNIMLILILSIFFLSCQLQSNTHHGLITDFDNLVNCSNTSSGWECRGAALGPLHPKYNITIELMNSKEEQCIHSGGRWTCRGLCSLFYDHYCDFPSDDAGATCNNSHECQWTCTVPTDWINTNFPHAKGDKTTLCPSCQGICSAFPLRFCDRWYSLENGTVIGNDIGLICD